MCSGKTGDGFLSGLTEREKNHGKSNQSDAELYIVLRWNIKFLFIASKTVSIIQAALKYSHMNTALTVINYNSIFKYQRHSTQYLYTGLLTFPSLKEVVQHDDNKKKKKKFPTKLQAWITQRETSLVYILIFFKSILKNIKIISLLFYF